MTTTLAPVFDDGRVRLFQGDARQLLDPALGDPFDVAIVDPPYGETSLEWDRWVKGWPAMLVPLVPTFWCFGSFRMFFEHRDDEFADWKIAQEIVWEKHNGSSFHADRFKRVHELAVQFYRRDVDWRDLHHEVPTTPDATARAVRRKERPPHTGQIADSSYVSHDGGPRLMRSVLAVRSCHGYAVHPTQKPLGIIEPLIAYSCPPGGAVLDPFAGSGSTLLAARNLGRYSTGYEARTDYIAAAVARLQHDTLDLEGA